MRCPDVLGAALTANHAGLWLACLTLVVLAACGSVLALLGAWAVWGAL